MRKFGLLLIFFILVIGLVMGCGSEEDVSSNKDEVSQDPSNVQDEGNDEQQQKAEPFYNSGDTIELVVPFSAGGGTDVVARFFAPYLTEFTEGQPNIQTVNIPGAGAVIGSNDYVQREPDGYNLINSSSSVLVQYLLGNPDLLLELKDLVPIIALPHNSIMSISPDTGYTEPKDLLNPEEKLFWGASDSTGGDVRLILALEALEIADQVEVVFGYGGGGATRVAYEQGETNMDSQTTSAHLTHMTELEKQGKSLPLFQIGMLDRNGEFVRDPALPDVMTVKELYVEIHGKEPSNNSYEALKIFGGLVNNIHKTIFINGDAPPEAIEALVKGAEAASKDANFKAEAIESIGSDYVMVGEDLDAVMEQINGIDENVLNFVRELLTEKYGAQGIN